jgi:uncharacterized protein YoxC
MSNDEIKDLKTQIKGLTKEIDKLLLDEFELNNKIEGKREEKLFKLCGEIDDLEKEIKLLEDVKNE